MKYILKLIGYYFNTLSMIAPRLSGKHTFYLFCYPFKAKLRPKQQSFLNTGAPTDLPVGNITVKVYQWGEGKETILFVHGWQSNSYRWRKYVEAFDKNKYTLYAFDAPGHGNSAGKICNIPLYEQTIQSFIKTYGSVDHLIGHSIGSFACASFMYHHNYAVKSYTSLASPFGANEFLKDYQSRLTLSEKTKENFLKFFKAYAKNPIEHYSLDTFLPQVNSQKTLFIHDKHDVSTSYQESIKADAILNQNKKNSSILITEKLGHSLRSPVIVDRVIALVKE